MHLAQLLFSLFIEKSVPMAIAILNSVMHSRITWNSLNGLSCMPGDAWREIVDPETKPNSLIGGSLSMA